MSEQGWIVKPKKVVVTSPVLEFRDNGHTWSKVTVSEGNLVVTDIDYYGKAAVVCRLPIDSVVGLLREAGYDVKESE